tara:strand:+ start:3486 stop:3641 length:156 start_codon:yes stop_codon:yes gene_type:complete
MCVLRRNSGSFEKYKPKDIDSNYLAIMTKLPNYATLYDKVSSRDKTDPSRL